jgi:hypothetical protein
MASAGSLHPQVNVDLATVYGELGDTQQYKLDVNDQRHQRRLWPDEKIFTVWPEPPPDGYLHLFVSNPGMMNITPPESRLDIEAIDEKINRELNVIRGMIKAFLKNPEPRIWKPPEFASLSNQDFITDLRIPCYHNGNPSLLFHNLNVCGHDKEIKMVFGSSEHQYVVINCALNASQHVQAGSFATHLAQAKPVACWKASRNTGDSTLLQFQIPPKLASEIYAPS